MKYMGSKNRLAKHILPIMLKHRKSGMCWVEPFVGGGNMIDKVEGWRIGADLNEHSINALTYIRDNLNDLPKNNLEFTEKDYMDVKHGRKEYKFKSYVGFIASFGGTFMSGWARDKTGRDYIAEGYGNASKQSPKLLGVELINCNYLDLVIPANSLIYCDPPYKGTAKYENQSINHEEFFQWCRDKAKEGHIVFVSEYKAPDDFECMFEAEIKNAMTKDNGKYRTAVEKLFKVRL